MTPLRFTGYERSAEVPNVVIDGSPNAGTVLVLSHWPGIPTPSGVEADSSCQMVFRYLDRGADLQDGARVVTNNHFDQDGLAGIYPLTDPDDGVRRRRQLEGLAQAGDFGVAPDRTSARISMAISALDEAAAAFTAGQVRIEEHPHVDLAVVTLPERGRSAGHRFAGRRFDGIHPMALHAATERSVVLVIDPTAGRHHLTCRYEGWVQFRSRPIRPRVDLAPLAAQFTAEEPTGAVWSSTPPADLTPELATVADGPASSLAPEQVVGEVTRFLAEAPPAWDPYEQRT